MYNRLIYNIIMLQYEYMHVRAMLYYEIYCSYIPMPMILIDRIADKHDHCFLLNSYN